MTDLSSDITPLFQIAAIDGILDGNWDAVPLGHTAGDGGVFFQSGTLNVSAVPEPSTLVLVGLAGVGFGCRYRKQWQARNRSSSGLTKS